MTLALGAIRCPTETEPARKLPVRKLEQLPVAGPPARLQGTGAAPGACRRASMRESSNRSEDYEVMVSGIGANIGERIGR